MAPMWCNYLKAYFYSDSTAQEYKDVLMNYIKFRKLSKLYEYNINVKKNI